jgi:hypothetical protein
MDMCASPPSDGFFYANNPKMNKLPAKASGKIYSSLSSMHSRLENRFLRRDMS